MLPQSWRVTRQTIIFYTLYANNRPNKFCFAEQVIANGVNQEEAELAMESKMGEQAPPFLTRFQPYQNV